MRKIGIGLTTLVLAGMVAAPVAATPPDSDGTHKVIVCHATSSESNPYVRIEVDLASAGARGLKKIMGHHEHAVDSNKNGGTRADAISAFEYDTDGNGSIEDAEKYPAVGPAIIDEECPGPVTPGIG